MGLKFDMIACDHGLIWRKDPAKIITAYDRWSKQQPARKALVLFDTMWRSTQTMARAVYDGLMQTGVSVQLIDLRVTHRSDVVTELLDAAAIAVGSSTLKNSLLPRVAEVLTYIKGLRPKNKIAAAFGSYGWSGEAVRQINGYFEQMKVEVIDPGVRARYVPDHEALAPCVELGRKLGEAVNQRVRT
jgi:flavorubredoxin